MKQYSIPQFQQVYFPMDYFLQRGNLFIQFYRIKINP